MMNLMIAAALAAQPTPPAHGQMPPMDAQKHEAMKEKCCCEDMKKGEHDKHAEAEPQDNRGH